MGRAKRNKMEEKKLKTETSEGGGVKGHQEKKETVNVSTPRGGGPEPRENKYI